MSLNPFASFLPSPWAYRYRYDRNHGCWFIELRESDHTWNPLTEIRNGRLENAGFDSLEKAAVKATELGVGLVYKLINQESSLNSKEVVSLSPVTKNRFANVS